MAKKTTPKKAVAKKAVKPGALATSTQRTELGFDALLSEITKGNKTCTVSITVNMPGTDAKGNLIETPETITFKGVKAFPQLTGLLTEYGNDWKQGNV